MGGTIISERPFIALAIGDHRHLDQSEEQAGIMLDVPDHDGTPLPSSFIDRAHADMDAILLGEASKAGGAVACANFRTALKIAGDGDAGAVCFTPFNKAAM